METTIQDKTTTTEKPMPQAGRKEWIGLAVIALPCMLYSMDLTVLNLALPHITTALKPSSSELLWIIDIYGFLIAGLLITMGTLGDRIGRRKLLMIGAAAFGVASVIAAFATSAVMLIACRALLGIAGATLAPSTLSLIRNMFLDPKQRTVAIGVWITSYSIGGAIGPLVGGALLEHFWWGSVFLVAVPVMVLLLILGPMLLPEFRDPQAGRIDLLSALLSLVAVLAIIFGLKKIAEQGMGWLPVLTIGGGVLFGVLFLRRQRKLTHPLLDLALFRTPAFSASLAIYSLGVFVAFGTFIFSAQHLQLVVGLSPMKAGLWTLPWSAGFILGSMLTVMIVRKWNRAYVMAGGALLAAVGFAIITQVNADSGLTALVAGSVITSFGTAPMFTLTTDLIIGSAPPERAGAASAISETGAELGGALGIAILGSVGTAIYRTRITDDLPANLPPAVADAAKETLGGAVAEAAKLPGELSAPLLSAAREAFVEGLQLTAITNVVIVTGLAILAILVLRRVKPANQG